MMNLLCLAKDKTHIRGDWPWKSLDVFFTLTYNHSKHGNSWPVNPMYLYLQYEFQGQKNILLEHSALPLNTWWLEQVVSSFCSSIHYTAQPLLKPTSISIVAYSLPWLKGTNKASSTTLLNVVEKLFLSLNPWQPAPWN